MQPTNYEMDTGSSRDAMLDVLEILTGKKQINIPEDGKVKFNGTVNIELDFNKEVEYYNLSNIKPL